MQKAETRNIMVDVKADLRHRLLFVAIKLFAERGVEAVSMRTINSEAGTKNKSAVHYHFGSKAGILEAIFDWVRQIVEPAMADLWSQIAQREGRDTLSIEELMLALYAPLILVQQAPQCGHDLFKLWSKLIIDSNEEFFYMDRIYENHMFAILQRLTKHLPEKNREHLRFQITHSVFAFIAGSSALDSKVLDGIENAKMDSELEMLFSFIDYTSGGIRNTQFSQNKINLPFWKNYFTKHAVFLNDLTIISARTV